MRQARQGGFVLVQSMLLAIVVVAVAGLAMQRSTILARDTLRERGELQALQAAEGGLARARHELRRDPDWVGGEWTVGRCRVLVKVRWRRDGKWELTSRGLSRPAGAHGAAVQVVLVVDSTGRYSRAPRCSRNASLSGSVPARRRR